MRAGTGLLAAVTLSSKRRGQDPGWAAKVVDGAAEHGVISRLLADGSLQISPPFVATEEDFALLADAISKATEVEAAAPAAS